MSYPSIVADILAFASDSDLLTSKYCCLCPYVDKDYTFLLSTIKVPYLYWIDYFLPSDYKNVTVDI